MKKPAKGINLVAKEVRSTIQRNKGWGKTKRGIDGWDNVSPGQMGSGNPE